LVGCKGVFEQRAGGPMRIATGSLLRVLKNFRVADGSIILYQTGSALIALGHMPRGYLARIYHEEFILVLKTKTKLPKIRRLY